MYAFAESLTHSDPNPPSNIITSSFTFSLFSFEVLSLPLEELHPPINKIVKTRTIVPIFFMNKPPHLI